jgi:hypothetical protein
LKLERYMQDDITRLEELYLEDDPRGLGEMIAEDHYVEVVVEEVTPGADGYFAASFDDGLCGGFKMPEGKSINAGDTLRIYQRGDALMGGLRHGFAVNGAVIEWKTPWERFADRITVLASHDRERRESFPRVKADIDCWYALLHGPYKARIDRFRSEKPDFDLNGGSYETYPVLMAQRIEEWVRRETETPEIALEPREARGRIEEFRNLPHDEQSKVIHDGEPDVYGISGHQFDSACGAARVVLEGGDI